MRACWVQSLRISCEYVYGFTMLHTCGSIQWNLWENLLYKLCISSFKSIHNGPTNLQIFRTQFSFICQTLSCSKSFRDIEYHVSGIKGSICLLLANSSKNDLIVLPTIRGYFVKHCSRIPTRKFILYKTNLRKQV